MANIPVGSYDGGGRGKEREKERDREKEREREKDKESSSRFSFEVDKAAETGSPATFPPVEGSAEAPTHSVAESNTPSGCCKEANAKEVSVVILAVSYILIRIIVVCFISDVVFFFIYDIILYHVQKVTLHKVNV